MYISWITPEALETIGIVALLIGFAVTLIVPVHYAVSTAIEDRRDAREHLARRVARADAYLAHHTTQETPECSPRSPESR